MSPLDCMAFGYLLAIIVLSRRPMALQYWRPLIEYCAEAFWEVVLRRVTELNISDNKIGIIITTEGSLLQTTISIISNLIKYCLCSLVRPTHLTALCQYHVGVISIQRIDQLCTVKMILRMSNESKYLLPILPAIRYCVGLLEWRHLRDDWTN